jgi:hypothetical protein
VQLTYLFSVVKKKTRNIHDQNFNSKLKKNLAIGYLAAGFVISSIAEATPKYYSKIENGIITSQYRNEKAFVFSREENSKIITKILSKLPLAQSVTIVSSSKPLKVNEWNNALLGFKQRNIRQVHMVAVSFSRSDVLPMMYFQVKEDWKDCEPEGDSCLESLALEIAGPSKLVRDLDDFGSFPKALNVLNIKLSLENQSATLNNVDNTLALVNWQLGFTEAESGVEDYLRFFRSKAGSSEQRITLQNVKGAMSLWASQVSKSAFTKL